MQRKKIQINSFVKIQFKLNKTSPAGQLDAPSSGRKWSEVVANDRKWLQMIGSGRKWSQMIGSGRKWSEVVDEAV